MASDPEPSAASVGSDPKQPSASVEDSSGIGAMSPYSLDPGHEELAGAAPREQDGALFLFAAAAPWGEEDPSSPPPPLRLLR